jgi:hypothetical protein
MKLSWMAPAALVIAGWLSTAAFAATKPTLIKVPAGTPIMIELADPISTKTQKAGDNFAIRLAEPLVVRGRILAPQGATGVGTIIDLSKPGLGGKPAKLVLSAKYINQGKKRIPLDALQVTASGRAYSNTAQVVGLGGIGFAPLGFVAMAIHGGDVELPAGTMGMAKISTSVTLASLGAAPRGVANSTRTLPSELASGPIKIDPPPPGRGQVVFFRPKTVLGTAQWFNVREEGKALGKLVNGAYFVEVTTPGLHTYTAKTEPEFNDKLKLQIDPGETYFVEGVLTKGVVIGAADLTPSDSAAFEKAAKGLKPAPAVSEDQPPAKAASAG